MLRPHGASSHELESSNWVNTIHPARTRDKEDLAPAIDLQNAISAGGRTRQDAKIHSRSEVDIRQSATYRCELVHTEAIY